MEKTLFTEETNDFIKQKRVLLKHRNNLQKQLIDLENLKIFKLRRIVAEKRFIRTIIAYMLKRTSGLFRKITNKIPLLKTLEGKLRLYVSYLNGSRADLTRFKKQLYVEKNLKEEAEPIAGLISVIIPTFNAGVFFDLVLRKITTQKYVPNLELIVIDSGSTDGTVSLAKKYGAKILTIDKKEFSHAKVRNKAAKAAKGSFLFFTVQDAALLNEDSLYGMVHFLWQNKLGAISGKQTPRSDADAFASWQLASFAKMINPDQKDIVVKIKPDEFKSLSAANKRAVCIIDDVCAVYDKEAFDKVGGLNNKLGYGEDLDVAKRLIESGYGLGYLFSTGVIHSHTRPANYFVKRFYTDTVFLYRVFKDMPSKPFYADIPLSILLSSLVSFGRKLAISSASISTIYLKDFEYNSTLKKKIDKPMTNLLSLEFLEDLGLNFIRKNEKPNLKIEQEVSNLFKSIKIDAEEFMNGYFSAPMSQAQATDVIDKIFAICATNMMAVYQISQANQKSPELLKLHSLLTEEI